MAENKARHLPADAALAQARYVRMTPQKVRRVVDLVRGRKADEVVALLEFAPQAAGEPVRKLVQSAVANAANNKQLDPESLWVSQAYVDEGPTMKRFRPGGKGRAFTILKRTSHITVVVEARAGTGPARGARRPAGNARRRSSGAAAQVSPAPTQTSQQSEPTQTAVPVATVASVGADTEIEGTR